jgi:hypothetical protein
MKNVLNPLDYGKKNSIGEQVVATILDDLGLFYFYDYPVSEMICEG